MSTLTDKSTISFGLLGVIGAGVLWVVVGLSQTQTDLENIKDDRTKRIDRFETWSRNVDHNIQAICIHMKIKDCK